MNRKNQTELFRKQKIFFGGSAAKGNPKSARPFSKKCDSHVVLKSRFAVGERSFLRKNNQEIIRTITTKSAKRFYVSLRRYVNVGNHLHLLFHAPNAEMQRNFLRTISALIARQIMGTHKGSPMGVKSFWDGRPFSRLIPWGRAFKTILNYLTLNSLEAIGFSKTSAREYLKEFSSG